MGTAFTVDASLDNEAMPLFRGTRYAILAGAAASVSGAQELPQGESNGPALDSSDMIGKDASAMATLNGSEFDIRGREVTPGAPLYTGAMGALATAFGGDSGTAPDEGGGDSGTKAPAPTPEPAPAQPSTPGGERTDTSVNLAAWARGDTRYIFAEVRLAIVERFGRLVTGRWEAIQLLIEKGVIPAAEPRQD